MFVVLHFVLPFWMMVQESNNDNLKVKVVESSGRILLYPYHVSVPYPIMRNFKPKNY